MVPVRNEDPLFFFFFFFNLATWLLFLSWFLRESPQYHRSSQMSACKCFKTVGTLSKCYVGSILCIRSVELKTHCTFINKHTYCHLWKFDCSSSPFQLIFWNRSSWSFIFCPVMMRQRTSSKWTSSSYCIVAVMPSWLFIQFLNEISI